LLELSIGVPMVKNSIHIRFDECKFRIHYGYFQKKDLYPTIETLNIQKLEKKTGFLYIFMT
jgi:hypothetical protein